MCETIANDVRFKYTFGETFGPFDCEKCKKECWSIYVDERPKDSHDIIYKKLGDALCSHCAPTNWQSGGDSIASFFKDT